MGIQLQARRRWRIALLCVALIMSARIGNIQAGESLTDGLDIFQLLDIALVVKGHGPGGTEARFALAPELAKDVSTPLGVGRAMEYFFKAEAAEVRARVIRFPSQAFAILEFRLPEGLKDAATGDYNTPALAFALKPRDEYPHVFTFEMKAFAPPTHELIPTAGPVILYNDALDVLIISPLDNFLVGLTLPLSGELLCGIEGEVEEFPQGFCHRVIVLAGPGVNASMDAWGNALRSWHGKERIDPYKDKPLSCLGYWTDNGSYYYYNTAPGMNYEDTLIAVKKDADERGIPFGYFQLDSWWYKKTPNLLWMTGGTLIWEAKPKVFPHGVKGLHESIGLPFVAHNRWFVQATPLKKEYDFVDGQGWRTPSIPIEQRFWDMMMDNCIKWGIEVYEQDWLVTMYDGVPYLRNSVDHAETWLEQMTGAASERGLTMQFCMAPPGFFLQNVKLKPVTHARCSGDYLAGGPKIYYWPRFFKTSMLAWAVGLYPFKDCYMTTPGQRTLRSEKFGVQETLISNLSAGPVGPGDRIGFADKQLLMRTCRKDGLLLKPDRPAMPIDEMFLETQKPFIVTTLSEHSGKSWHYVAGFNLYPSQYGDRSISLSQLGIEENAVIWDWREQRIINSANRINFPDKMKKNDYAYYIVAPVLANGMAVIGEFEKFVTASRKRFERMSADKNSLGLEIRGVPEEKIKLLVYSPRAPNFIMNKHGEKISFDYRDSLVSIEVGLDSTGEQDLIVR